MIELPIYKKYFDAILELKKPFELRHEPIKKGTKVKLVEIEGHLGYHTRMATKKSIGYFPTGRYIIFESGECTEIKLDKYKSAIVNTDRHIYEKQDYWDICEKGIFLRSDAVDDYYANLVCEWWDNFCWDYINEKQTYLIEINKILEVGGN